MRVGWVLNESWLEERPGGLFSRMASYRYRAIIPGKELGRHGFETFIIGVTGGFEGYERARQYLEKVDVVVFGKLFEISSLVPHMMVEARRLGVRTVVDICDVFLDKYYAESYRSALAGADAVTAASTQLAKAVADATGRQATVISDPYENARGTPRWSPGDRLVVTWFGNVINLPGLDHALGRLLAMRIPIRLIVVTELAQTVLAWERFRRPELAPSIDLDLREWSVEATAGALRECDAVLLPVDPGYSFYQAKGPDRMVEALWAGRYVAAQPIAAYEEFRDWAWVGEDIAAGLAWAFANPAAAVERIAAGQAYIAGRYSPAAVADSWASLLSTLDKGPPPS